MNETAPDLLPLDGLSNAQRTERTARVLEHFAWCLRHEDEGAQPLKLAMQGLAILMESCTEHPDPNQLDAILGLIEAEFERIAPDNS